MLMVTENQVEAMVEAFWCKQALQLQLTKVEVM